MGRIKEIERKASGRRKRKPVVYLICEGSETEIRYFKKFCFDRDDNTNAMLFPEKAIQSQQLRNWWSI